MWSDDRNLSYQDTLAKCYVAMAEVDYDLREWTKLHAKEDSWVSIAVVAGGRTSGYKKVIS